LTSRAWAAGSPGSGIPAENFSLRLTGVITFPTAGDYKLSSLFDDGGRVWLDDILVIDDGVPDGAVTPVTSLPFTVTAGERKRIRIDFFELAGAASLDLKWALGTSTPQPIPDTAVTPGYNLPTSSTVDDSVPGASGLASNLV